MKFEITSEAADIKRSVFGFPGDEAISESDYEGCINAGYASSVATLAGALEGFGVELDKETFERCKRMASVVGLGDDLLDESPSIEIGYEAFNQAIVRAASESYFDPPAWGDERLITSLQLFSNSVKILSRDRQENILLAAEGIADLALVKSECTNAHDYSSLLKNEARLTNLLVMEAASTEVRNNSNFQAFLEWAESALEAGTLTNSLLDLREDYIRHLTSVQPSVANRLRIAKKLHEPVGILLSRSDNLRATYKSLATRIKY